MQSTTGSRSPGAPAVTARLDDGPLAGTTVEADRIEGRPPKVLDLPAVDGEGTYRYCLTEWEQSGMSAAYSFLYRA